jgi:class 3 adenylate cyclase
LKAGKKPFQPSALSEYVDKGVTVAIASLEELLDIAQDAFDQAMEVASTIKLSLFTESVKYARTKSLRIGARLLAHEPSVEELGDFWGLRAWAALLSFDLRDSSTLAVDMAPRDVYAIMHTYLTTMLKVIEKSSGIVVGLRGDGAIASFGWVEVGDDKPRVTGKQAGTAVQIACDCGDAMVHAMKKVINPVLKKGGIKIKIKGRDKLQMGVGIDVGEIVATRIGLGEAHEFTAYGTAVNHCCKRSFGNDEVVLTKRAKDMFPKKKGGKTKFHRHATKEDAFILRYPDSYRTVE